MASNISADLVWEATKLNNAYLVKRAAAGGVQLSRDPLNLLNKNSRKHAGFANEKAAGVQSGERGTIILTTKKAKHSNRPASSTATTRFRGNRSGPKIYKGIANSITRQGYRPDLREAAVARASALRQTSRSPKDTPEKKLRGAKAKKIDM